MLFFISIKSFYFSRHWRSLEGDPRADETEELCSVVANLLFTVLWRGMDGSDGDTWRRRGQVLAAVNLLGLNNELHCSHLEVYIIIISYKNNNYSN